MIVTHNSHELKYRNPFGAVPLKSKIYFNLYGIEIAEVFLHLIHDDKEERIKLNQVNSNNFEISLSLGEKVGVLYYYFSFFNNYNEYYYGNNELCLGGEGKVYIKKEEVKYYQITIYNESTVSKSYKEGTIYQIFVDRFLNGNDDGKISNPKKNSFIYANWDDRPMYIKNEKNEIARWDFFGGNLLGIIKKLDYIKELGVSTIYLNPIFESSSCHKYDTGDYEKIDPMFGNENILKTLCEEAKKRKINIILDGVFSHTGDDSKYFNRYGNYNSVGAYQSKDSKYYSWYRFNNFPDDYESWWGFKNQPNVNELNETYIDYIIEGKDSIVNKWMSLGINGWRLDVADELPDEFIERLKKQMKFNSEDSVLIGEVWEDASNKTSYGERRKYFNGKELDSVTNYIFRNEVLNYLTAKCSSKHFACKINSIKENYPKENFLSLMNILSSHDTERCISYLKNSSNEYLGKYLFKLAIGIQMSFPGVPLIYYGDEVGLEGGKDPDNRRTFPWNNEDNEILIWYKKLTKIRIEEKTLVYGDIEFINYDVDLLIFKRIFDNKEIIVIVNRNFYQAKYIELKVKQKYMKDLINDKMLYISEDSKVKIDIKPLQIIIMK